MFEPKYSLNPELVNNLSQIERLYGQLEALRIPKKLELNLERANLVKSSYVSNSIEGNPLSLPEVTNLLLDDRVPANRDEKEVRNYFDILKKLPDWNGKPLALQTVSEIHKDLLLGVDNVIAGQIRNKPVVVGGYEVVDGKPELKVKHQPPFHTKLQIEQHLTQLCNWVEKDIATQAILKAGIFHHQYVYLHPFEDGNGRTCRLLTALVLLKFGYQINKYFVLDDYYDVDRFEYSDMLNSADSGDKTEWLTYFTSGVKYSLQSAQSRVTNALKTLSVENRPSPKEQEVLSFLQERKEITSTDVVERFEISRQQAHKLLAQLVEKGFADKKGETKSSFYVLK